MSFVGLSTDEFENHVSFEGDEAESEVRRMVYPFENHVSFEGDEATRYMNAQPYMFENHVSF